MTLYDQWKRSSYDQQGQPVKRAWDEYLAYEKKAYKKILSQKLQLLEGTVAELAEQLGFSHIHTAAFMDGIQEAIDNPPEVEKVEADTAVKIEIDFKRLYKQMVEYKAKELYNLPEWDDILTQEEQKELYTEQKQSKTIKNAEKIGRNDPCSCGSGKKHKKCCGAA